MVGMRFGFCDAGCYSQSQCCNCKLPNEKFNWFSKYQVTISDSSSWIQLQLVQICLSKVHSFQQDLRHKHVEGRQYQATVIIHFPLPVNFHLWQPSVSWPQILLLSGWQIKDLHYYLNHFIKKKIIHLALSGLYCHTQNLHCITQYLLFWHTNSLVKSLWAQKLWLTNLQSTVVASQCRSTWLSCSTGCGSWFPDQGWDWCSMHCTADS